MPCPDSYLLNFPPILLELGGDNSSVPGRLTVNHGFRYNVAVADRAGPVAVTDQAGPVAILRLLVNISVKGQCHQDGEDKFYNGFGAHFHAPRSM
jgi:hypothetical protein